MAIPQLTNQEYWKRYVIQADLKEIQRELAVTSFTSGEEQFELAHFSRRRDEPCILISPGSAGHAYVFAELAHHMHARGYSVFIMHRHGGRTIAELVRRHEDAVRYIAGRWNERIGVFGEGLGGYVTFYLALGHGPVRSIACQNAPAILTEPAFHEAVLSGGGGASQRRRILPVARALARVAPRLPLAISSYLDFRQLVDTKEENRRIELPLVDAYLHDPDFDGRYPLSAVLSLMSTPPPRPLEELAIPTMFIVPSRGFAPAYARALFRRLPSIPKKLVEVDGSVFWMVSHPREAAATICSWFDESMPSTRRDSVVTS